MKNFTNKLKTAMCAYACFAGTFPQHHAGTAATTRNLLGLWPQPSASKLRAATGHPESSSLRLSFQPSHFHVAANHTPPPPPPPQIKSCFAHHTHAPTRGTRGEASWRERGEDTLPSPGWPGTHLQAARPGTPALVPRPRRRRV